MEQLHQLINNFRKREDGQLLIEIILAIAITAIMLPALLTGLFSSKQGKAQQGQRVQAIALMKEAGEVSRNVKEQNWNSFAVNGTYHPTIGGNKWVLSSGSDTTQGLTRTITISDVYRDVSGTIVTTGGSLDTSTKKVLITVTWQTPFTSSVDSTLYLTRYNGNTASVQTLVSDFNLGTKSATIITNTSGGEVTLGAGGGGGDWCNPSLSVTTFDLSRQGVPTAISAYQGSVVTGTGGNASGPTFVKTAISGNSPPIATFIGEFNNSKANAVFTENNYGYIATTNNNEEIQILNLTQYSDSPTNQTFSKVGYFNAPGNTQGNSVLVSGNYGYMTAADKFYIFDLSGKTGSRTQVNPTAVTLSGTGNKIVLVGNYVYVVTTATSNQFQIINVTNPTSPTISSSLTLGTQAGVDLSLNSTGTRAYIVTNHSLTEQELYIIDTTNKSTPVKISGTGYNTSNMIPKGISVGTGNKLMIVGTSGTYQYQVVNISDEASPSLCGHLAITNGAYAISSVLQNDGYAYSYVATGDSTAELKIVLGGAGGQFAYSGTYTSAPIDASTSATFNYFNPSFTQPNQTSLTFQVAVAAAVNNNCSNANYSFLGPDRTSNTYFTGAGSIPLLVSGTYSNPGRCMKYKAYFTTNDITVAPILNGVIVNYSP